MLIVRYRIADTPGSKCYLSGYNPFGFRNPFTHLFSSGFIMAWMNAWFPNPFRCTMSVKNIPYMIFSPDASKTSQFHISFTLYSFLRPTMTKKSNHPASFRSPAPHQGRGRIFLYRNSAFGNLLWRNKNTSKILHLMRSKRRLISSSGITVEDLVSLCAVTSSSLSTSLDPSEIHIYVGSGLHFKYSCHWLPKFWFLLDKFLPIM